MKTIGGILCTRNCLELDYCFEASLGSLLPLCDQIIIADSDSTDGTRERLDHLASEHPKIRVVNRPWRQPVRESYVWWTDWINDARGQLTTDYQIHLDADEVLHENSYEEIRRAADSPKETALICHRHTFWRDLHHLVPHGRTCGELVTRFGPQRCWMCSDEMHPEGEPEIRQIAKPSHVEIFHYGFLRRREALFAKCKVMLNAYFGSYDSRLEEAEKHPDQPWWSFCHHDIPLREFRGSHPIAAHQWLIERGFDPKIDVV